MMIMIHITIYDVKVRQKDSTRALHTPNTPKHTHGQQACKKRSKRSHHGNSRGPEHIAHQTSSTHKIELVELAAKHATLKAMLKKVMQCQPVRGKGSCQTHARTDEWGGVRMRGTWARGSAVRAVGGHTPLQKHFSE